MPPRAAKKTPGGGTAVKKTPSRAAKSAARSQVAPEEAVRVEEVPVPVPVQEVKKEVRLEEKHVEPESVFNASVDDEDDLKEVYEEEDKGERLELDDNEPEYEEETAVDYDEKEIGEDDGMEEEPLEEDAEEGDADEEKADMVYEEVEDGGEDVEAGEDDGNVEEGHDVDMEKEHLEVVNERRKRKEFEIFVGGLDKDATEDDLRKVFSAVGDVTEIRLMMNPLTKKNKGFAFLRFATVEQAKRAVSELKNPVVNGKQCGIAPSHDDDTLFLSHICKTWTKEHLKEKLKSCGIENFEGLNLFEDTSNAGHNRGFAFLEFFSRSEAMDAFRRLQKRDIMFGADRPVKVSFAVRAKPDDEVMSQVKTVFIDGLSPAWDEDRVKGYLKKYGEIEKVELARNMPAAKRKDFGFVTFDTHDNAVKCAESINTSELGEGDSKILVRARLSRPLQRGRGKHGPQGDFRVGRVHPRADGGRMSWGRPPPHRIPVRSSRPAGVRGAPIGGHGPKRPMGFRDRRPIMAAAAERARRLPPPPARSYERRPPVPAYPKSSSKRDYSRRDDLPPRTRAAVEYEPRIFADRRSSYRDEYSSRGSAYTDIGPRSAPRIAERRPYADEGYERKLERPIPTYREGRPRDYDNISGSKRPYSALDDIPPRYTDVSVRQSRPRMDYGVSGGSSQYEDSYNDRLGRSQVGYGSSRSSISGQDSHGLYGSRHGMSYGGGSVSSSDVGGMYSSSFSTSYLSRGSDVGSSSYSSLYSGRSLSGGGYLGSGGSGSYY